VFASRAASGRWSKYERNTSTRVTTGSACSFWFRFPPGLQELPQVGPGGEPLLPALKIVDGLPNGRSHRDCLRLNLGLETLVKLLAEGAVALAAVARFFVSIHPRRQFSHGPSLLLER